MHTFFSDISFTAGTPRYIQLATILEQAIRQNAFSSKFLPPERELAKLLNVSRVTVSNALKQLEEKNLVIRQQGLGTQINIPFDYSLNQLSGFTKRMEDAGFVVTDQWLDKKKILVPYEIAKQLNIPENAEITYLHRVRLIDNRPISIESTYIPLTLLPDPEDFTGSLYTRWEKQGIYVAKKTVSLHAVSCDKQSAQLLRQPENTPLLKLYEINRDSLDNIIEVSEVYCLSQYYALQFEL